LGNEDCVFCQVLEKQLPGKIEYEDDDLAVIWDINRQAPTHLLIIPKKHIEKLSDVEDSDSDLLCKMFVVAKNVAKRLNLQEQGYRLVVNEGRDAGQSIFHLHMHLLSGRRLMWPPAWPSLSLTIYSTSIPRFFSASTIWSDSSILTRGSFLP